MEIDGDRLRLVIPNGLLMLRWIDRMKKVNVHRIAMRKFNNVKFGSKCLDVLTTLELVGVSWSAIAIFGSRAKLGGRSLS